jgi:GTPase
VNQVNNNNTILVGIDYFGMKSKWSPQDSIQELAELADTAGLTVVQKFIQNRDKPHNKYFVGKGKLEELNEFCKDNDIKILIADDELTPMQLRNLEETLKIKVLDRTSLILDIFATHARTYEAQLQVEFAQLEYLLPRLTRMWTHLSRLGGGIGTRGPGEKQLEVDKRQIRKKIGTIKTKLEKIKTQRKTRRDKRQTVPIITGTIVGYTNAGKSTLMNTLTKAGVLTEDKLFATLDPTTRKFSLDSKRNILLTDTVGFIQKLPHQLISSFRSTLEETVDANFLLHLIDVSHPNWLNMLETANNTLKELKADQAPKIYVFNKMDLVPDLNSIIHEFYDFEPKIFISAKLNKNIDSLIHTILDLLQKQNKVIEYSIPYQKMDIVNLIHNNAEILEEKYEEKIHIKANINSIIGEKILGQLHHNS